MIDMRSIEGRRKFYAFGLLTSFITLIAVSIFTVWSADLLDSNIIKILVTLLILMGISGYLYIFSFGYAETKSKVLVFFSSAAAVMLTLIVLLQIWFGTFDKDLFIKLAITFIIVKAAAYGILAIVEDFFDSKKLKDENYLD